MSNLTNRTIFCRDNLDVLNGINSDSVDLIYLDPPFNKKKQFTAPVGSSAEGASFSDIFREKDIKDEWVQSIRYENHELHSYLNGVKEFSNRYNYCYLVYMSIRLLEMYRVLKPTGTIYLHCDPAMSHYLKIVMDSIFGEANFGNEIIWGYRTGGASKRGFGKKHDVLFRYTKKIGSHIFNPLLDKSFIQGSLGHSKSRETSIADNGDTYQDILFDKTMIRVYKDKDYRDGRGFYTLAGMRDIWNIDALGRTAKERTGYPTQKPIALLERIISSSSNEGDMVLDPFCGCATTCVAAEKLNREWVGVDVSQKAYELVKSRLNEIPKQLMVSDVSNYDDEVGFKTSPPKRTDTNEHLPSGNIYIISNPQWPNRYKVGIAKNVKQRLNSYQTSDPDRGYELKYSTSTPHYKEIERYIHDKYPNDHEWVTADLDALKDSIETYKP